MRVPRPGIQAPWPPLLLGLAPQGRIGEWRDKSGGGGAHPEVDGMETTVVSGLVAPTHELRFVGRADEQVVPANVLAETLQATQRTVHLLAMATRGQSLGRRARISQDIERAFPVLCMLPQPGSYIAPIQIGDPLSGLLSSLEAERVTSDFDAVLEAAEAGDAVKLREVVPDSRWREAVTDAVARMLPRPSSGFSLLVNSGLRHRTFALSAARQRIEGLTTRPLNNSATRAVIGYLQAIDFGGRKLRLRHPMTNRTFDCVYAARDDFEPVLLENPRELIQVVGEVELDANDHPIQVVEVSDIRPVDLEPFVLSDFYAGVITVHPINERLLRPCLDETQQFFLLEDGELGIDLADETRAGLEDALRHLLPLLWRNYAQADDAVLTGDARLLKQRLLATFTETPSAAPEQ